jgi:hypothetical protein
MRAHAVQTSMIGALSRSLRLTKRYTRADEAAASGAQQSGKKPWLDWNNDRQQ